MLDSCPGNLARNTAPCVACKEPSCAVIRPDFAPKEEEQWKPACSKCIQALAFRVKVHVREITDLPAWNGSFIGCIHSVVADETPTKENPLTVRLEAS